MTGESAEDAGRHGQAAQAQGQTPEQCQVLGDVFGVVVQGLLAAVVACTLLLKWWLEKPQRRFKIFALDSSKQFFGAGAIHVSNMLCAVVFASMMEHHAGDECAWYWVNIMIDTTFGVVVCYALLKATEALFGYDTGHYGKKAETGIDWEQDPDYGKWFQQIVVWCFIVMLMKAVVVCMMAAAPAFWVWLANSATHWIHDRQHRLIFVMIVTPTMMNMFQFLVQDSFLKHQKTAEKDLSV